MYRNWYLICSTNLATNYPLVHLQVFSYLICTRLLVIPKVYISARLDASDALN
jgi:hypothetical protein